MTEAQTLPTAAHNKQILQHVFAELATGNRAPFSDRLADDIAWTITGTTRWSRTYRGKQAVRDELFGPLYALFADRYTNTAHRFLAEGDWVVVECRGRVTTTAGKPYHNSYCMVCRLSGGKICELIEYCDTALIDAVL
ncbi:MAG TPA: nuclear transport factor 2 family protein [Kofleriaceae bacterium]|nr:nuclear transport factor 2 family protein [Kofleriaceae bacterium]